MNFVANNSEIVMRLKLLLQWSLLRRHFSARKFDGKIPLECLQKSVTFREDRRVPHVEIRIPLKAGWIPTGVAECLRIRYPHRIDRNGSLVVESCQTYSDHLNMADCIDKLRSAMLECQAAFDGVGKHEAKSDQRVEVKHDIKRRLAAFESRV